ncbi:MAG TPA: hypothetical protein VJQ56_09150, partial [Blastocatellia bacterium]|nr:hypothetical protein [Blastocatellia bacterium]
APLVWMQTQNFSANSVVTWEEEYQAYTSNTRVIPNAQIVPMFSAPIMPGQALQVRQGGYGMVVPGGPPSAFSILNQTSTQYTCGISQAVGNSNAPCCAFPLYGNMMAVIAPTNKVLLMFSSIPINVGTVAFQAYSPGILIDLTGTNQRNVTYDINSGWSGGGASWAQNITANSDLIPLLIQPPQ